MPFSTFKRRADAVQRQTQFDQGDGDGRPHADDDRLGVEHVGHACDIADHPADERIDHVQAEICRSAHRGRRSSAILLVRSS